MDGQSNRPSSFQAMDLTSPQGPLQWHNSSLVYASGTDSTLEDPELRRELLGRPAMESPRATNMAGYWKVDAAPPRLLDPQGLPSAFGFGQAPRVGSSNGPQGVNKAPDNISPLNSTNWLLNAARTGLALSSNSNQGTLSPSLWGGGPGLPVSGPSVVRDGIVKPPRPLGDQHRKLSPLGRPLSPKISGAIPSDVGHMLPSPTPMRPTPKKGTNGVGDYDHVLDRPVDSIVPFKSKIIPQNHRFSPPPMSIHSTSSNGPVDTPTPFNKRVRDLSKGPVLMNRPFRQEPKSPVPNRMSLISDLEPPKRVIKTPRRPKLEPSTSHPPRDLLQSRASNVSKRRSQQSRAPSPERPTQPTRPPPRQIPESQGYLQQGVNNVQNFGTYWNGFITDLLQQLETADGELKEARANLAQSEGQVEELEHQNSSLQHDLKKQKKEWHQLISENEALADQLRDREVHINELSMDQEAKLVKIHALGKKLKDHLNAAIKEGEMQYAAGKNRWTGAILETRATGDNIKSLKETLVEEVAKYSGLNVRLEELTQDVAIKEIEHMNAIGTLEIEKQQLNDRIERLEIENEKLQDENRRLQERAQGQQHIFTEKLEGSLQRLESHTTDLAHKLDNESVQAFQAQISEKLDIAIAKLTMAASDARVGEKRLEDTVTASLEERNTSLLSDIRTVILDVPAKQDLNTMVEAALGCQAQAFDNHFSRAMAGLADQWTALMTEKLGETSTDIKGINGSLQSLQEIKILVSGLDSMRTAIEEIGNQETAASDAMKKLGDTLEAQDGKLAAVALSFEERISGFLGEHLNRHTGQLQEHFVQQSCQLQECLEKQDTRLEGGLKQQESQLVALAGQVEKLRPALPATKKQVSALQRNLGDIQQRISNMLYKVRNSGPTTNRGIREELEAVQAETRTISSQIAEIATPDVDGNSERVAECDTNEALGDEGGIRKTIEEEEAEEERISRLPQSDSDEDDRAKVVERKVVVQSPGCGEGWYVEPPYDRSQPPRSIMKTKNAEKQTRVDIKARLDEVLGLVEVKESSSQETDKEVSSKDTSNNETTNKAANNKLARPNLGGLWSRSGKITPATQRAAATSTEQGEFFPQLHEAAPGWRQSPFARFGIRTSIKDILPEDALTRGLSGSSDSAKKRDNGTLPWLEPQLKRPRTEAFFAASRLQSFQNSVLSEQAPKVTQAGNLARRGPKPARIVRTYSRKDGGGNTGQVGSVGNAGTMGQQMGTEGRDSMA